MRIQLQLKGTSNIGVSTTQVQYRAFNFFSAGVVGMAGDSSLHLVGVHNLRRFGGRAEEIDG
ncbi:hypothetical protein D5S18_18805 [Nocardia panacis]|uniref:Uncharacterized protein n=1 Tax=Nocardia panacis TaxID=2340916 RepID=A0A3A4KLQ4_9NOCA|nr:hypothetical protein D5S18_18805 [Nocardia panacis]